MKGKKGFYLAALLLLCSTLLFGCAKKESDIAKEIVAVDGIFTKCNLKLDGYKISKRQTNNDDKTDYVWLTLNGSNDDLEYTADYVIEYVKYNDGWHLENFICDSSSYTPKKAPGEFEYVELLTNHYDSLNLYDTTDRSYVKQYTQLYHGTIANNRMTTTYLVTIDYEFSANSGWRVINTSEQVQNVVLNLVGEWLYQDETHLYYLYVSDCDSNAVTLEYALLNKNPQPDDGLWSLRKIDNSTFQYHVYTDDLIYTMDNPMVYIDVNWKRTYSTPRTDDKGLIWFSNKSGTFMVNGYQLEQVGNTDRSEHYPEELRNAKQTASDYGLIPAGLMDSRLIDNLSSLKMTYGELGLNTNKSSGWQGERYPFGKVTFMGQECSLFLYCVPADTELPYMLGFIDYSREYEEIIQYFLDNPIATVYEDTRYNTFTAVLNGTDIAVIVRKNALEYSFGHPEVQIKVVS